MKRCSFLVLLLVLAANRQSYCQTFVELLQAAGRHWAAYNLDSALTYSRLTLAQTRILYGNDDTTYADILANYIAPISALASKISDAVAALDTAEGIYRKAFGKEHAKIATVLHRRGTCLWDLARYEEGEKLLRQSLHMRERLLGPDHGVTQQTLVNLAAWICAAPTSLFSLHAKRGLAKWSKVKACTDCVEHFRWRERRRL